MFAHNIIISSREIFESNNSRPFVRGDFSTLVLRQGHRRMWWKRISSPLLMVPIISHSKPWQSCFHLIKHRQWRTIYGSQNLLSFAIEQIKLKINFFSLDFLRVEIMVFASTSYHVDVVDWFTHFMLTVWVHRIGDARRFSSLLLPFFPHFIKFVVYDEISEYESSDEHASDLHHFLHSLSDTLRTSESYRNHFNLIELLFAVLNLPFSCNRLNRFIDLEPWMERVWRVYEWRFRS